MLLKAANLNGDGSTKVEQIVLRGFVCMNTDVGWFLVGTHGDDNPLMLGAQPHPFCPPWTSRNDEARRLASAPPKPKEKKRPNFLSVVE